MSLWEKALVTPSDNLEAVIHSLNQSRLKIAMVVDSNRVLLGVVSDGDIRRAILNGKTKETPAAEFMNRSPISVTKETSPTKIRELMRVQSVQRIPVIDSTGRVCGLKIFEEIYEPAPRENRIVLMAGGMGARLSPLTDAIPKPLLKVGGRPILENILENCRGYGFKHFYISVNYKAEMIKAHFGDGLKWGSQIEYLEENKQLGTAGALTLLKTEPTAPIIVMNGDLLTNVDLDKLLEFHEKNGASATMAVKEYDFQVPYGVIQTKDEIIQAIDEKPTHRFLVNAGIYVVNPEILHLIPSDEKFNMTELFSKLLESRKKTCAFPIHEYWLDIGKLQDFEQAQTDAEKIIRRS